MTDHRQEIIITDTLADTATLQQQGYITHALCRKGGGSFCLGNHQHTFTAGDCLIIPQQSLQLNHLKELPLPPHRATMAYGDTWHCLNSQ